MAKARGLRLNRYSGLPANAALAAVRRDRLVDGSPPVERVASPASYEQHKGGSGLNTLRIETLLDTTPCIQFLRWGLPKKEKQFLSRGTSAFPTCIMALYGEEDKKGERRGSSPYLKKGVSAAPTIR